MKPQPTDALRQWVAGLAAPNQHRPPKEKTLTPSSAGQLVVAEHYRCMALSACVPLEICVHLLVAFASAISIN